MQYDPPPPNQKEGKEKIRRLFSFQQCHTIFQSAGFIVHACHKSSTEQNPT